MPYNTNIAGVDEEKRTKRRDRDAIVPLIVFLPTTISEF